MYKLAAVLAASLILCACATKRPATEAPATDTSAAGTTAPAAATPGGGMESSGAATASDAATAGGSGQSGPQGEWLSRRTVYFDFDRAEIRSADGPSIGAHAQYLVRNPGARIRLEGHTDAQGTREYNIGLAERRAQAVRRALQLQGVAEGQSATVSYGEERPAVAGDDEATYAQNRRVEIIYAP